MAAIGGSYEVKPLIRTIARHIRVPQPPAS